MAVEPGAKSLWLRIPQGAAAAIPLLHAALLIANMC
jgi:hypothetical protein